MPIRLIAGLGNPGKRHERDRHNVGFWLLSRFAAERGIELKTVARYQGLVGKLASDGGEIWLVEPQTYMNLSGRSVGALARFYKIFPADCLVVHDELDFPPGVAKLKQGGGAGGHNGLKDIAEQLGSQDFWRLRIGIGHPGDRDRVADYVLAPPSPSDRALIDTAIDRSLDIATLIIAGDMAGSMLKLHTKA
ncbi:MAG: aminoacyl-tRNA hydrolase [Betaproteobacteria bacterium]|nr:aminoacyl-tRNA hydrolase [Betaproteobacteria bacterium]